MKYLINAMLIVVGIIHLLPMSGFFGADRLEALYGLSFSDPNLELLMRHRAILFGLLGAFLIFAAFKPVFQLVAFVAGFFSVVSFLYLSWAIGGFNEQIGQVFLADVVALICLVIGLGAWLLIRRRA